MRDLSTAPSVGWTKRGDVPPQPPDKGSYYDALAEEAERHADGALTTSLAESWRRVAAGYRRLAEDYRRSLSSGCAPPHRRR